ncbi:hypothetical protein C8R47DRAFT_1227017 [Mycena vitilis]|nr:hypothetical protein C8R47DRAFT_1227017 [Mycena vitilis]
MALRTIPDSPSQVPSDDMSNNNEALDHPGGASAGLAPVAGAQFLRDWRAAHQPVSVTETMAWMPDVETESAASDSDSMPDLETAGEEDAEGISRPPYCTHNQRCHAHAIPDDRRRNRFLLQLWKWLFQPSPGIPATIWEEDSLPPSVSSLQVAEFSMRAYIFEMLFGGVAYLH